MNENLTNPHFIGSNNPISPPGSKVPGRGIDITNMMDPAFLLGRKAYYTKGIPQGDEWIGYNNQGYPKYKRPDSSTYTRYPDGVDPSKLGSPAYLQLVSSGDTVSEMFGQEANIDDMSDSEINKEKLVPKQQEAKVSTYLAKDKFGMPLRDLTGNFITGTTQEEADKNAFRYGLKNSQWAKNTSYSQNKNTSGTMSADVETLNAITGGALNRLSPTQNVRFLWDAAHGNFQSAFGNNGIVSDKFAEENPNAARIINGAGDLVTLGGKPLTNAAKNEFSIATASAKPYTQFGKDFVAGAFGTDVYNATSRALTGRSHDDVIYDSKFILGLPIKDESKRIISSMTNPGGWLSWGASRKLGNTIAEYVDNGLNGLASKITKPATKLYKKVNGYPRILAAHDRANKYYKSLSKDIMALRSGIYNISDMSSLNTYSDFPISGVNSLPGGNEIKEAQDIYLLLLRRRGYIALEQLLKLNQSINVSNLRPSSVNLEKVFNPTNQNTWKMQRLVNAINPKNGVTPITIHTSNPVFELNTGLSKIPKFGTSEIVSFNISSPKKSIIYNPNNPPSSKLTEEVVDGWIVPPEYIEALLHNINYVKLQFPNSKVFGSAAGVTEAGLPHATGDIDLYILDTDLVKIDPHGELPLKHNNNPNTYVYKLDGGKYGELGDIDLNVIKTKPDGTLDFTSERSFNIFRLLYPDECQQSYLAAGGDLSKMHHPMKAQQVLDNVTVENTIMDAFESGKSKHASRALWYLLYGEPDQIYSALLKSGESLVGKNMRHAPVTELNFSDVNANYTLLTKMFGHKWSDPVIHKVAQDPKRMRNIFEYWWQNNTVFSRGTSIENMPKSMAHNLGIKHERNFLKYAKRNMNLWSGGVGQNGAGTGLNTVLYGDSGGGVAGNDIYGQILPELNGNIDGLNPQELMNLVRRNYPHAEDAVPILVTLPNGLHPKTFKDILNLGKNITPEQLHELGTKLGIRGIIGNPYHESTYAGLTSPAARPNDITYITPANGRNGLYVSPTSDIKRPFRHQSNEINPLVTRFVSKSKHYDSAKRNAQPTVWSSSRIPKKLLQFNENIQLEKERLRLLAPLYMRRYFGSLYDQGIPVRVNFNEDGIALTSNFGTKDNVPLTNYDEYGVLGNAVYNYNLLYPVARAMSKKADKFWMMKANTGKMNWEPLAKYIKPLTDKDKVKDAIVEAGGVAGVGSYIGMSIPKNIQHYTSQYDLTEELILNLSDAHTYLEQQNLIKKWEQDKTLKPKNNKYNNKKTY